MRAAKAISDVHCYPSTIRIKSHGEGHRAEMNKNIENSVLNGNDALKPFSLTYVVYDKDDKYLGFLLALFTLLPVFLIVMYVTLILARRNLHTIYVLTLQLVNEVFNYVLKNTFKEPRPDSSNRTGDYGFPSNHSQFMAFFATYWSLYFLFRKNSKFSHVFFTVVMTLGIIAGSAITCYSRFYLGYHSPTQIYGGIVFGIIFGIFSFIGYGFSKPLLQRVEDSTLGKYFYLRNTEHIINLLQYEYRSQRLQKKVE